MIHRYVDIDIKDKETLDSYPKTLEGLDRYFLIGNQLPNLHTYLSLAYEIYRKENKDALDEAILLLFNSLDRKSVV